MNSLGKAVFLECKNQASHGKIIVNDQVYKSRQCAKIKRGHISEAFSMSDFSLQPFFSCVHILSYHLIIPFRLGNKVHSQIPCRKQRAPSLQRRKRQDI